MVVSMPEKDLPERRSSSRWSTKLRFGSLSSAICGSNRSMFRRCYTVQFPQQRATQQWKMFLLQLPRWGVTLFNAIWVTCNNSGRESLAKLATGAPGSVVGWIVQRNQRTLGKIALQVAEGVLHCAMAVASCPILPYTIVGKSRTGFYSSCNVARNNNNNNKKMRCKLPRYPVTIRIRCVASCWKIALCNRAFQYPLESRFEISKSNLKSINRDV